MRANSATVRWLLGAAIGLTSLGCVVGPDGANPLASPEPPAQVREYRTLAPPEDPPPLAVVPVAPPAAAAPAVVPLAMPTPPPPPAPTAAAPSDDPLQRLQRKAVERFGGIDSYIARLRRCEETNGKSGPVEVMAFQFRKQPWSVHFKWLDGDAKGREVLYVKDQHEDKIHTLLAAGDMPLMPAGKQIALAPDSVLVRGRCRYPITEAGLGSLVERFGQAVAYRDRNGNGILRYLGPQKRPEYDAPLEAVEQTIPPGVEEVMSKGGRRYWYFDPASNLPVLVVTQGPDGRQVEYYCYDRMQYPVKLDAADFDPVKLWGKPQ